MNSNRNIATRIICVSASLILAIQAQLSGLPGLSEAFLNDLSAAREMMNKTKSAEPLLELQKRYTSIAEQAELEVSIGVAYGQIGGVVNPSQAVIHLTKALQFELPEKAQISIWMWRGNAQEQLKKPDEALMDYLRDLLACSCYDLEGGWKEIQGSKVPMYFNSADLNSPGLNPPDPENVQRLKDYNTYRRYLGFEHFLLSQRYFLIDAVKRVRGEKSDTQILEMLQNLTPDSSRCVKIMGWLKSENKRPWP